MREGYELLTIDAIDNSVASDNLGLSVSLDCLVSICYTSGSTGEPKGAIQSHRYVLHFGISGAARRQISRHDRLSLTHSVSFGSACTELFQSLLNGAALFPFDLKSEGIHRFASWLTEEKITVCHLPPRVYRQLAESLPEGQQLPLLRLLYLSGAPVLRLDFDFYRSKGSPATRLEIGMGSTESGMVCSAILDQTFPFPHEGAPVGYPVEGKKVMLLDDNGNEVEPGEVGEIAVKSRYLTLGYWRKPKLNRVKFLPDPSGSDERIYLTGDLGRILPDGFLIHLGRKDVMVKIRGYRVEPSEIESALLAYPQVQQAGVVAWDRELGEKYLVAYVVPRDATVPTVSELHDFLMGNLPEYMMPSSYVFLRSLPLTNGKLDRSRLPLPDNKRPDMGHPYVPSHTDVQQSLVQIWEDILDVRPIGIHDDFFELGGHSLLASRLFVEIEKAFGKQLPITTLFYARNVEQLARIIQHEEWSAPWSLLFPIQSSGSKPPFFWVYGETSDVLLPRYLGPDQPLYGLMHEARAGNRVRYTKLNDIAANHLKDIQTVQPQGPYFLGGFCFGGMVAFEMAQQLQKQGQEVALLFLVDLATVNSWRSRFEKTVSFRHKFSRHSRNLASIGVREKVKYVQVKVEDRIRGIILRGKNLALTVARNAYFATGRVLPPLLRLHYLNSVDHWAMRHYEPEMYPGDLILYKSEQRSYDPAWVAKFITGKLHLRELPCGHSDLLKEPDIALWAEELKACLEQAQSTQGKPCFPRSVSKAKEESLAD